jgi:two-component system, NarL family, nitrate/nitrite response regulator NarL
MNDRSEIVQYLGASEGESRNVLRVLIADDHRMISEVMAIFLTSSGDFTVDLAETLDKALEKLNETGGYDIVMLDLMMPGMVGTDGIDKVIAGNGSGSVVLFTSRVDRFTLDRALDLGVKGVIPKTMPAKSLISALRLVHSGETFLPSTTIENRISHEKKANALSETELFILRLAAAGYTNKQIANDIDQNETSIKMYMRSICSKLNARNRAHAAMIGRDLKLLPDLASNT